MRTLTFAFAFATRAVRMCREILSSCVRNTEEAEKSAQASASATVESGRGQGKGVWGMIEESELAKTIRLNEEKKVGFHIFVPSKRPH